MKHLNLTLSFLLLSTALVQAESDAETALKAMMEDINKSGVMKMEIGSTHYQSDTDTLTAQNVVYRLDWALPNEDGDGEPQMIIKATFNAPMMTAEGLKLADGGISYKAMSYEGNHFTLEMDGPGTENDMMLTGKAIGEDRIEDGFQPFLGEFKIALARPIGSVMDYIRPLILEPRYGKYSTEGYTTKQDSGDGTVKETTEWGPMTMTDVANGKIGSVELAYQKGTMDFMMPKSEAASGDNDDFIPEGIAFEIGKTIYEGYNLGALWSVLDPNAPKLTEPTSILKSVEMGPVKVTSPNFLSITAGPSTQKDFLVSPVENYIVPYFDDMVARKIEPDKLPKDEQEEVIKAAFELFRGFSMGVSEASEIKGQVIVPAGDMKGQSVDFNLDKIRFANLNANGIEEFSLAGVAYKGPPAVEFSLGRFALENLEFPDYNHLMAVISANLKGVKPSAADSIKMAPNALELVVENLDFKDARANAVSATQVRTAIDRKGLAVPAYINTKVDNLTVSKSMIQHPLALALLGQLGLDSVTLNEEITLAWNSDNQTLNLDPLTIELADIAKLSGAVGFGGIMRDYLDNPEQAQAAMATGTVLPSTLTLTNLGGVNEIINLAGGMTGMGPEQIRSFAQSQVQGMLGAFTKPDFAAMVASNVKTFLTDPQTLKIVLQPAAAVPVAQIIGAATTAPHTLPDILNIGVSANQ